MSSLMTDSSLNKATLAVTKLKGAKDLCLWFAVMHIALDHSWRYIEGPEAIEPSSKILTSIGASIDPSKCNPDNPDQYEDNPAYDVWAIKT